MIVRSVIELIQIFGAPAFDVPQCFRATADMCDRRIKSEHPLQKVWADAADWANVVGLGLLVKCQEARDASFGDAFKYYARLAQARLWPGELAVFDHYTCHGSLGVGG